MSTPSLTRAVEILAQPTPFTLDEMIEYMRPVTPAEQRPSVWGNTFGTTGADALVLDLEAAQTWTQEEEPCHAGR